MDELCIHRCHCIYISGFTLESFTPKLARVNDHSLRQTSTDLRVLRFFVQLFNKASGAGNNNVFNNSEFSRRCEIRFHGPRTVINAKRGTRRFSRENSRRVTSFERENSSRSTARIHDVASSRVRNSPREKKLSPSRDGVSS